ncbi:hypothetical protein EDB85DRAFT_1994923, partial [Lactarius pseudohatsudake]
ALWDTFVVCSLSSSVMTRMISTRVNPFAGEVQLTCSRLSCFPAPIYLSKEFDFPQHELSVNSYANYYPIPTYTSSV